MQKIKQFVKKYLPDIIIIIGVWILFYNILIPNSAVGKYQLLLEHGQSLSGRYWQVFGVVLITIGADIFLRKYISYKNKK
jgi:hypothetical protein